MKLTALRDLLTCPISWQDVGPNQELEYWLNFIWFDCCHQYQIDQEVSFLFSDDNCQVSEEKLGFLDDVEIEVMLHNVGSWIAQARTDYLPFVRRFAQLGAVGRETYSKHYTTQLQPIAALEIESAKRRASVLLPTLTTETQELIVWSALDDLVFNQMADFDPLNSFNKPTGVVTHFKKLFDNHSIVVAVDFRRIIGASNGNATTYGYIDFDFSTPQFHLYPVSEEEYQAKTLKVYVQGWNFGLQS